MSAPNQRTVNLRLDKGAEALKKINFLIRGKCNLRMEQVDRGYSYANILIYRLPLLIEPRISSPITRQASQFPYLSTDIIEALDSSPYAIAFIQPEFHLSPQLLPQLEP